MSEPLEVELNKRSCDHPNIHPSPCNKLLTHISLEEELKNDMAEIKETLAEVKEILTLLRIPRVLLLLLGS